MVTDDASRTKSFSCIGTLREKQTFNALNCYEENRSRKPLKSEAGGAQSLVKEIRLPRRITPDIKLFWSEHTEHWNSDVLCVSGSLDLSASIISPLIDWSINCLAPDYQGARGTQHQGCNGWHSASDADIYIHISRYEYYQLFKNTIVSLGVPYEWC
jgi:hypothetical protein